MVLHLIALGVFAAVGHGVNHLVKEHESKKQAQAAALSRMTSAPQGYAPQPSLLFDYELEYGEELIATFAFTPAKWTKELLASNEMFPRTLGMTLGIGHVTSERVLLMFDMKRIEDKGWWSHGEVEMLGTFGGKLIEHAVNETLGKIFEGLAHIDAETRKHMERIAMQVPKGVVSVPRGGDWGLANGCVFFKMDSRMNYAMAFAPSFIDDEDSGNEIEIFKKILQFGPVSVDVEKTNSLPWYGSRSDLDSFVI